MAGGPTSASSVSTLPRELLSGIDTLEMSGYGDLWPRLGTELPIWKAEAQAAGREPVVVMLAGESFRIRPTGIGGYTHVLEHKRGLLGIGDRADRPPFLVDPSAEALHGPDGPAGELAWWRDVVSAACGGSAEVQLMARRVDVHADFAGLDITDADAGGFVCQSRRLTVEKLDGQAQTLMWGKGGDVSARLYDKLAEIDAKKTGGYLLGIYGAAGLKAGETVRRVEAQVRKDALKSMGILSAQDAIARAGEVYLYVVNKWLRLVDSGSATRRERCTVDPRWQIVQAAKVGAGHAAGVRAGREIHAPELDKLLPQLAGLLIRCGAALGVSSFEDAARQAVLLAGGYIEDRGRNAVTEMRALRQEFDLDVSHALDRLGRFATAS